MIPSVCVLEWLLHSKTYTREVKISVFVVMIGVGVCTVTDVNVNFQGFMAALVAVISTSLQQIVSIPRDAPSVLVSCLLLWVSIY